MKFVIIVYRKTIGNKQNNNKEAEIAHILKSPLAKAAAIFGSQTQ